MTVWAMGVTASGAQGVEMTTGLCSQVPRGQERRMVHEFRPFLLGCFDLVLAQIHLPRQPHRLLEVVCVDVNAQPFRGGGGP